MIPFKCTQNLLVQNFISNSVCLEIDKIPCLLYTKYSYYIYEFEMGNVMYEKRSFDTQENNFTERKFTDWEGGLSYLILAVAVPLIPTLVYYFGMEHTKPYLYTLMISVVVPLLCEYLVGRKKRAEQRFGRFLTVEYVICSSVLSLMTISSIFLLFMSFSGVAPHWIEVITMCMFAVPVICTIIEIARCVKKDCSRSNFKPSSTNLFEGAGNV